MSYAIIRNQKYTKEQMIQLSPHNERHKQNYSNKNIDLSKTYQNYHLKQLQSTSYMKEFKRLTKENSLTTQFHPDTIYACEFIIASDKNFFQNIGYKETKRFFQLAYEIVCSYKNLGKENIISAVVHMDEETPHMHLIYIPVVNTINKKGQSINKISASEFWKRKNSYASLQNDFFEYISLAGFKLERGKTNSSRNYKSVKELKELTNFYETKKLAKELESKVSSLPIYTSIKLFMNYEEFTLESVDQKIIQPLLYENNKLMNEIKNLKLKIIRIQNAIDEYNDIKGQNESLKGTLKMQETQISVYENLILRLNEEKKLIINKCQLLGLNIENLKEQD